MAGRPPKPTSALKKKGTYRKDRHSKRVVAKPLSDMPAPPAYLTEKQLGFWADIAPKVRRLGVMAETDVEMLGQYCVAKDAFVEAMQICADEGYLKKEDRGTYQITVINPAWRVVESSFKIMEKIASHYGLSPTARGRLKTEDGEKPQDPFEKLLGGGAAPSEAK